jgi:alpha-L-rhamnosidase
MGRAAGKVPEISRPASRGYIVKHVNHTALRYVFSFILALGCARSAPLRDWAHARWTAQWIACPNAPQRDAGVFHFRKSFTLAGRPEHFLVHVSADNRFFLYVNGTRVGAGPASSDPGHWRYETFDLAALLHAGDNLIGATVWNFGTSAPIAQMTSRAGFILQGDGAAEQIANTGASWQAEVESGHALLPVNFMSLLRTYYAGPPGEVIDGRTYDWEWNVAGSDSGKWKSAETIGDGAARGSQDSPTVWMLEPDPLPPMEMTAIPAGKPVRSVGPVPGNGSTTYTVPAGSKASLLLDAAALTTAYPELTLSGGAGSRVRLTYAEALVDDRGRKGNRNETAGRHILGVYDEFLPGGGSHELFSPLIWRTWRYLQMDISTADQPLTVDGIAATFTAFPFHEEGRFSSDDPQLTQIWNTGWRTARLCAHETYMDTPYYERLQYVGDTRLQALVSYAVAGDDRLARQAIDAIDYSRLPEGVTRSRYPSSLPQIIPTFSLMWVGMVHDFRMHRDDAEFVRSHLPGTRAVLEWFLERQRADGLMGRLPWWNFIDWTHDFDGGVPPQDENGGSAAITLQFIEALRDAAEMERALGDAARAATYSNRAERAADAVWKLCWNERRGLLADSPAQSHFSQHANALAVWLDVIPRERQAAVMRQVLAATESAMSTASYYFTYYVTRAMEHAGLAGEYLSTLKPWLRMLDLGLTTWAEQPEPTRSDSHAWSAHPNYDLLRVVAGIRPDAPGFAKIVIEPHLGTLQRVDASMPHPKGHVSVSIRRTGEGANATIECPDGVDASLVWGGRVYPLHGGSQTLDLP